MGQVEKADMADDPDVVAEEVMKYLSSLTPEERKEVERHRQAMLGENGADGP